MSVWTQYTEMCDHIAVVRPDLLDEAKSYSTKPASDFGGFLDEHFPIPGSWGTQGIDTVSETLRNHYPVKS